VTLQKSVKTGLYTFISSQVNKKQEAANKKKSTSKKPANQKLDKTATENSYVEVTEKESNLTHDSNDNTHEHLKESKDAHREKELEKEYRKKVFLLPSCSQWFDLDEIHEIEIQSLPEFFSRKYPQKNPLNYRTYRNLIVKLFRENPSAYLTAATCRLHVPGDVCSILRL